MTMTINDAISKHGAKAVYEAGCKAMEGDYSALKALGLPASTLTDAWAAMGAHASMSVREQRREEIVVEAELDRIAKRGRPALPNSALAKTRAIRLSDAHYYKLKRLGMDWLRQQIEQAQDPH